MPKQVKDNKEKRINWFAKNVKLRTTPVFPGIDYRTITPAVKTLEDQRFLSCPPEGLEPLATKLCPHIFFSLPAMRLKVSESGLDGELDDQAEFSASSSYSTNKGTDLCELLHRVVRDPNSTEINFNSTYQKLNELVKTAIYADKSNMRCLCAFTEPFEIGGDARNDEDAAEKAFERLLEPICDLFSRLWKRKIILVSNHLTIQIS